MRRGEAKKALAILSPLAEANPGREDVLQRVIQVAEAAGDAPTVIRWRSALVDLHKAQGRVGDAATGLRVLLQLVPDSAEFRTRLSQLGVPAARVDADRTGSRGAPNLPVVPLLETSGKRPRPSVETTGQRRLPVEPVAPIPPPPSFAPSPPAADAAEGEFILDLEDDQLVHDPGSTGPVPNAVRRLSQSGMASFASPPPAAVVPPPVPLPPVRHLESAAEAEPAPLPLSLEEPGFNWSDAPRPAPRETDLEVSAGLPDEVFRPPSGFAPLPDEGDGVEFPGEPLPPLEPAPPPAPEAEVLAEALVPDAVESALAEADVFRKYGLYDKAVDHLRGILKRAPDTLPLREKLFELALEGGRKKVALAEAERLKTLYRAAGRDDRVSAIDALLVERTSAEMGEGTDSSPGLPAVPAEPAGTPETEPPADELLEIDFCLEQGMVVDASERLQALERKFAGHPQLVSRRTRLDGGGGEDSRPALRDILSEDFESVLDAELGRALTDEMARGAESAPPEAPPSPPSPPLDESALFSDEQEFFNFAGELQTEMKQESGAPDAPEVGGGDVPLEEIFREFKRGVEQQLSPEDYETHYNLGIAYKEMSLTDEAISEFQRAAKSPQYAVECCSMLGLCFLEKGLPQLAIKWYRKGLEAPNIREDDRMGLQYDLANIYADTGDRENAYRTFLEIYGSNASFRDVGERLKELAPA